MGATRHNLPGRAGGVIARQVKGKTMDDTSI